MIFRQSWMLNIGLMRGQLFAHNDNIVRKLIWENALSCGMMNGICQIPNVDFISTAIISKEAINTPQINQSSLMPSIMQKLDYFFKGSVEGWQCHIIALDLISTKFHIPSELWWESLYINGWIRYWCQPNFQLRIVSNIRFIFSQKSRNTQLKFLNFVYLILVRGGKQAIKLRQKCFRVRFVFVRI